MIAIQGLDQLYERVIDKGLCAACGACTGGCPYLTAFRGKTVMLERCTVGEGRCFAYCPMTFFDEAEAARRVFGEQASSGPLGVYSEIPAAKAADSEIASRAQGGGTVTALIKRALERGLIDAAILTRAEDGAEFPAGFVATSLEDVESAVGSRYVGSHSLAALREALERGFERIGVVGLPCQVRSVRKMQLYDLKNERLESRIPLVIGLFCNWAFSARDFSAFLKERFGVTDARRFHIPPPPANLLEIETSRGQRSIDLEDVRPLIQAACNRCPDLTSEFADVSVGMYEGKDGWNTVIVRTPVGSDLMDEAVSAGMVETEEFPAENRAHLERAAENKRRRASTASQSHGESESCQS